MDVVYALGAQYRANATFVMNSKTAGVMRKLKDADGRFLWSDGLAAAEPARLLGLSGLDRRKICRISSPVQMRLLSAILVRAILLPSDPDLRVLRDPFSAKPHVLFYATKRVGGDVSDFAAIKVLKFAAS